MINVFTRLARLVLISTTRFIIPHNFIAIQMTENIENWLRSSTWNVFLCILQKWFSWNFIVAKLGQNEPREEEQSYPQEDFWQELILFVLRCSLLLLTGSCWSHIIEVKAGSEEPKRKSSDSKTQVESTITSKRLKALKSASCWVWLGSLTLWAWRNFRTWILLLLAVSTVEWNHLLLWNCSFTDGAELTQWSGLEPCVYNDGNVRIVIFWWRVKTHSSKANSRDGHTKKRLRL